MLAATAAEGVHAEERTAVVHTRVVVLRVALHHVGAGEVAQSPHVFGEGCGVIIEGNILEVLHPEEVTGLCHEYLVREHLLDEAACLGALTRVDVAMTAVLVAAEHASRHLSVNASDEPIVVVSGFECGLVATYQVPFCGLAEALCHIDVVPVGQTAFLHPVGRAAVNLLAKLEQELLASPVVEPDDGEQVVAATAVLPVVAQELLVGVLELPLVVCRKHLDDAFVAAPLVVILQDLERQHVRPKLPAALVLVDGTEETVCLTAAQDALNPELRFVEQRLVVQDVSEVGIASEPVRHFFPAVTAAGFEPRVALLVEPVADFPELSAQSVLLP